MNFLGFNKEQWQEIFLGIRHRVNIFKYVKLADKHFEAAQMREIREGLEAGIDVSTYSFTYMTAEKMRIFKELLILDIYEINIIFSNYAYEYSYIESIYYAMQKGINVKELLDEYKVSRGSVICKYLLENIPIIDYIDSYFSYASITLIGEALKQGMDVSGFVEASRSGTLDSIHQSFIAEIIAIQKQGFDVQGYLKNGYDLYQIREVYLGKKSVKEKVHIYNNPKFSWPKMEQIRIGLEANLDVSLYANEDFTCEKMELIRIGLESGINILEHVTDFYCD